MRVLVTGASGFVGRHLISRLSTAGNDVVTLSRGKATGAHAFAGPPDLADIETWGSWPREIDVVMHLAALNPERGSKIDNTVLNRANSDATGALARRCVRENVRRIVYVSTALVHPLTSGVFDESSPLAPQNFYAQSKLNGERQFISSLQGSGTEGCIIRPVPVYGPGGRGMIGALLKIARLPLPLPMSGLGGRRSILSVHNLTDALVRCAESPAAAGQTFVVADEEPLTVAEITSIVRRAFGRQPWLVPAPILLLSAIAKLAGKVEVWDSLKASFVSDCSKIERRLAWKRSIDSKSALQELAEHMMANGRRD